MEFLFVGIFDFFHKNKKAYWFFLVLFFALCLLGASRIHLENDINKMIPHDQKIEAMNDVLNTTKAGEQIIFTFSFKDTAYTNPDSLITLQQQFQDKLMEVGKEHIKEVRSVVDDEKEQAFSQIALEYLPLFLNDRDYDTIDSLVTEKQINITLEKEHKLLLSPAGMVAKRWIAEDPIGILPLAFRKFQSLQFDPDYELYDGYIFNKDQQRLTFFVDLSSPASATGKNAAFFADLEKLLQLWSKLQPGLEISYFGGPAVAAGNAVQMRQDTILTLSITVFLLLALTYYVFRRKRSPLLLMLPVLFGASFGLASVTLIQGSISVIALGAGAVILGIAIDFSVHFMSHARVHSDMRENVRSLAFPLTLGAFTTIAAFFALRFANAPLLQDLGIFAACSLAGASLFTLIFLPHLVNSRSTKAGSKPNLIDKLAGFKPEGNKWLLLGIIIATPVLWHYANRVEFDGDLMHLNYLSPELKQAQEKLNKNNAYALSSVFVVAKAKDEETATRHMEALSAKLDSLKAGHKIRNSINPTILLPSEEEQLHRIEKWHNYWNKTRVLRVTAAVQAAAASNGFSSEAFSAFPETLQKSYEPFDSSARQFIMQLFPNAIGEKNGSHYVIATLKVEPLTRTSVLNALAINKEVIATDKQQVAERLLALLNLDFNKIFYFSSTLVFLSLLIAYGRIELALISFLPMAVTWVWILGLMSLLGLKFNIVNIIISTLIFGLGDDYSIFIMDSLLEKYRTGKSSISSSRSAVYLSVLTTLIGLGTLVFARHPALQSIAAISILGLICVVFVSQVLQPFLFNFLIQNRADKGLMPFTLWSLLKSLFAFVYFFSGCMLLTVLGFVLVGIKPFGKERSKFFFHFLLSKYTRSLMYIMVNVKKVIQLTDPAVFKKPAIYIANHASFLDILLTTMLHPRLVLLTNKWVWKSPVFGKIVRMAEYYPVANGAEESIEPLRDLVNRGYGIVVFPEGTRSFDDMIHRFHKGAFYIAEQLQLDIVPLLMHGVHYTMQKGDWLLKDGTATVRSLPAIKPVQSGAGDDYSQRTKSIMKYFRMEFNELKSRIETPRYFKEQLIRSYTYKGPVLEWYCRIKISLEDCYEHFHQFLPREGKFYDLGCGYGFMTYMLHWASEGRVFTGVDYDEQKIETAQNNYLRDKANKTRLRALKKGAIAMSGSRTEPKINFEQGDIVSYPLERCTGIIISDVLHYLLPDEQRQLLDKCFDALEKDGVLIVRDGVEELKERHEGTLRTEVWSTRILNFNKTKNDLHFISQSFLQNWAAEKGMSVTVIDRSKKTSNLIFVMQKA